MDKSIIVAVITVSIAFVCFALFLIFIVIKNYYNRIKNNRKVYDAILELQEAERAHLGKEIQDSMGATLSAIKLQVHELADGETDAAKLEIYEQLLQHTHIALDDMRNIVSNLTPQSLIDNGWVYEVSEHIRTLKKKFKTDIVFNANISLKHFSLHAQLHLLRILQELFVNSITLSHATRIVVDVTEENNQLLIKYIDDGTGFDFTQQKSSNGFKNIQSRIELLNGRISNHTSYNGVHFRLQFNIIDMS